MSKREYQYFFCASVFRNWQKNTICGLMPAKNSSEAFERVIAHVKQECECQEEEKVIIYSLNRCD